MHMTRRNLLRALGLLGPAYFLPSLRKKHSVQAASPTIPTRILFFYTPHGNLLRQWVAAPAGASAPTATNFALGPTLAPLQPMQSKITLLEGLEFTSQVVDPTAAANGHWAGQTQSLSATNRANPSAAGGISVDQWIAQQINSPSPVTVLPSLELSARWDKGIANLATSWAGSNQLVPSMSDPGAVYDRMFPNGPPASMTSSMPSAAAMAAATTARRRKSVLDGVLGEFNAIKQSLSSADQAKLNSHAQLIRDLEAQQALAVTQTNTPTNACNPPSRASVDTAFANDCNPNGDNCVNDSATAFVSLATTAFACDLTRVITWDFDAWPDSQFANNPNVAAAGDMHGFLHGMDDLYWFLQERYGSNPAPANAFAPADLTTAISFYAGYASVLLSLMQQLDAITEPDGSTLLDHTIIVWTGELGTPNHDTSWVNYLLAGGGAAGIKTGRYLALPRTHISSSPDPEDTTGIPHNNLFVSLANLMGISATTFGNSKVCTGPLTQLTS